MLLQTGYGLTLKPSLMFIESTFETIFNQLNIEFQSNSIID